MEEPPWQSSPETIPNTGPCNPPRGRRPRRWCRAPARQTWGGGVLAVWYAARSKQRDALELRYFSKEEFGAYWPMMSRDLLLALDDFRHRLGYPVAISPAPGAIGRPIIGSDGELAESESSTEKSYHNYLVHGEIMAGT